MRNLGPTGTCLFAAWSRYVRNRYCDTQAFLSHSIFCSPQVVSAGDRDRDRDRRGDRVPWPLSIARLLSVARPLKRKVLDPQW